jgi:hypothetical protein
MVVHHGEQVGTNERLDDLKVSINNLKDSIDKLNRNTCIANWIMGVLTLAIFIVGFLTLIYA